MAQLKYTKVIACSIAAAAAGLVGIYLYKRRSAKKPAQNNSVLVSEINRNKKSSKPESCNECQNESAERDIEIVNKDVPESSLSINQNCNTGNMSINHNCNTGNGANSKGYQQMVEEPCIQVATTTLASEAPPLIPHAIADEPYVIVASMSTTEIQPPPLSNPSDGAGDSNMVVEELCVQVADVSTTQAMLIGDGLNSAVPDHTMTNGLPEDVSTTQVATSGCNEGLDSEVTENLITNGLAQSPLQIDEERPMSFDWATSVEAAEKGVASPTCSTHNGSVAGSDLGSESNSESSSFDSGRSSGGSTSSTQLDLPLNFKLEFPSNMCGKLIGKQGRNIRQLMEKTKASILIKEHPYLGELHIVTIEGKQSEIDAALLFIKNRFSKVDITKQYKPPVVEAQPVPGMSQLPLPEEILNDVYVSSVVSGAHVFVQQPMHPTFTSLQRLDVCMAQTYIQQADTVPLLPRPIESGVICAAPMMQGWYRAQVIEIYPETDECDIKFLDYGGYAQIDGLCLRQIRSDFMTLPFQAVECYLTNLSPLPGANEFSETARLFVEHVSQNFATLHAKVKAYSQDAVPLIELYYTDNEGKVHSLNKELVNQGLVSWFEGFTDGYSEDNSSEPNTQLTTPAEDIQSDLLVQV